MKVDYSAAEFSFVAPVLTDIFSRYADNSVMADIVGTDGVMRLSFRADIEAEPPADAEQVLSLLFRFLGNDSAQPLSAVYARHREAILSDVIERLSEAVNSLINARISLISEKRGTRTEVTLDRKRSIAEESMTAEE